MRCLWVLGVAIGVVLISPEAHAGLFGMGSPLSAMQRQLFWGSDTNKVTGESGQSLPYSETTGSGGAFAQLIWVGPDGAKDPFDASDPDGTGGDDVVVDISYSYGAVTPGTKSNQFSLVGVPLVDIGAAQNNSNYYVRVYNGANPNYGVGASPITGVTSITYYYESDTHAYQHSDTTPDEWNFTSGENKQTITPVPEPTTMGLMAVGALALVASRRRRKS